MALAGLKVIEFAGLAPAPFAGLVLAHNGATVVRIDRPSSVTTDLLCDGKHSIILDTKLPGGLATAKRLIAQADVVIDPFRPGVLERMGLGPDVFYNNKEKAGLNDKLIFARMSGFPRNGPHGAMAGHDINYIALSGVLSLLPGTRDKPSFPLNLLGDFAGGGMMCAMGILLALIERGKSGRGQVVDADMVSGTRYVSSFPLLNAAISSPLFNESRGGNFLDGGAPFYDVYTCLDGRWMSVGCLETTFFAEFIEKFDEALGEEARSGWKPTIATHSNRKEWAQLRNYLEQGFKTRPRDYWAEVFHGSDACAVPVLSPNEAAEITSSKSLQPTLHPELMRTRPSPHSQAIKLLEPGQHTDDILTELGLSCGERRQLALEGALGTQAQTNVRGMYKL
ncbi:CoA-transferase family III [Hygrophoropsis aurantiaca]|uniref:CoA-transferase family III n=1 Tax=Hygrophoropsis aurantiaca TaxID=72124 RepID=A0ACB8AR34_9AGAM|nr:CoA-transferase family III [Hygrophoropsis aurantiaca]